MLAHSSTISFDVISISEICSLPGLHATLCRNTLGILLPVLLRFYFRSGALWHVRGFVYYWYRFHIDQLVNYVVDGKLATTCRDWAGFVPMLPASDRFWLGCGALWHMCGREDVGVIVLVFRISRYFNSSFRILSHVMPFSGYPYAAVYHSL